MAVQKKNHLFKLIYECADRQKLVFKICSVYTPSVLNVCENLPFQTCSVVPRATAVSAVNLVVHSIFSLLIVRIRSSCDSLEVRAAVTEDDFVDFKLDVLDFDDCVGKESVHTELDVL